MAISNVSFTGALGSLSFYKSNGKALVRGKGGGSKEKINTSPSCTNIRRSNVEFGGASSAGALFRNAIGRWLKQYSDSDMIGNLTGKLRIVIALGKGIFGERELNVLTDAALLSNFEFNTAVPFNNCFTKELVIDVAEQRNAALLNTSFIPARDLLVPSGATAFSIVHILATFPKCQKNTQDKRYAPIHSNERFIANTISSPLLHTNLLLPVTLKLPVALPVSSLSNDTALISLVGIAFYTDGKLMKGMNGMKVVRVG
jgi:hypothetical protein